MNPIHNTVVFSDRAGLQNDVEQAILSYAGLVKDSETNTASLLGLVEATSEAVELCGKLQRAVVHQARRSDIPWSDIGAVMGITRQAAQQRFASEDAPQPLAKGIRRIPGATGLNEMQILETEGKAGYHLVDFGPMYISVMSSNDKWEHRRLLSLNIESRRARMEAEGWTYVGSWFPFHYFRRIVS
jgi:hypothetical protein